MSFDPADAVVVGSGAGGAAAAWALTKAGLDVVLIEAGPSYDPFKDYRLDQPDWERGTFPAKVETEGRQTFAPMPRLAPEDDDLMSWDRVQGRHNLGKARRAYAYQHAVGVGGSTLRYTGEAHRLNPAAFTMRSRFGVAADWPLTYDELEPFYLEAERVIGVAGPEHDPIRPRSAPYPLPPHPLSYASTKLADGCRALGLSLVPNARAALSRPYDGRPDCNYCGQCQRGCPRTDKGSTDVTFIRKAKATGHLRLAAGIQAVGVLSGPDDRVVGVVSALPNGRLGLARGRAVVLACGAVETPRLLLASTDKRSPHGLANESGQVGRNFMETLLWASIALHPEPLGSYRGLPADSVVWDRNAPDAIQGTVGGCRFTAGIHEADLAGPIAYASRVAEGFGAAHRTALKQAFGHALAVGSIGECLPDPKAFIDLDPKHKDRHSMPKARIHARLDDGARTRIRYMRKTARAILAAAGCDAPIGEYGTWDTFNATHVFGTCRMGNDAADSVVDRWGRSHRWRNLFVADASVFPSSGSGEGPSLTISALAIRTARHIAERAAKGEL